MEYSHNCIKCSNQYSDNDPDAYYCESCNNERKIIAQEVDRKRATLSSRRKHKSDLEIFNDIARMKRGGNFVNVRDLGITPQ